jgi:hypothetical protein
MQVSARINVKFAIFSGYRDNATIATIITIITPGVGNQDSRPVNRYATVQQYTGDFWTA